MLVSMSFKQLRADPVVAFYAYAYVSRTIWLGDFIRKPLFYLISLGLVRLITRNILLSFMLG